MSFFESSSFDAVIDKGTRAIIISWSIILLVFLEFVSSIDNIFTN